MVIDLMLMEVRQVSSPVNAMLTGEDPLQMLGFIIFLLDRYFIGSRKRAFFLGFLGR